MTATCPFCRGRSDDALLCRVCMSALTTDLRGNAVVMGVAELVDNLHVAQAKQARMGGGSAGESRKGDVKHERLPINIGAMEAARHLEAILGSWAMDVTGDQWWPVQGRYVAVSAAEVLLDHMTEIRRHSAVDELADEIRKAIDGARQAVDKVDEFRRFPVGPCPEDCDRTVFALCPAEDSLRPALMACYRKVDKENRPDLGAGFVHSWDSAQFYRAGARIRRKMEQQRKETAA